MTKETKDAIAVWSAVGMLVFGAILCIIGFFISPMGIIHNSVLYVLGQCLIYAGGIFGISMYVKKEVNEAIDRHRYKEEPDDNETA